MKEEIKNGWYVEYNESAGFNKNYKGLKVDKDLLNEIQKIDKKLNEENASYSKFYVEKYENGEVILDSRIRIDIGDGEEVNKEIFLYLEKEIQQNNIKNKKVGENKSEEKNGYYYRTFSVKKKEGEPVEEYQSQDEEVIKKHFERMKKDVKNEIVDFEKAFYKNNVEVAILESKTEILNQQDENKLKKGEQNNNLIKNQEKMGKEQTPKTQSPVKRSTDEINEYYKNYEVKVDKALSANDMYAFFNKTNVDKKEIPQILESVGVKIEDLKSLRKNEVLAKVVYPVKEAGKEKEFKTKMVELIKQSQEKKLTLKEEKEIKTKIKKDISEIISFYQNYDISYNIDKLSHTDIYAFKVQYGDDNSNNRLEVLTKELTGKEIQLDPYLKKNEVLARVVYPVKEAGKEKEFKTKMVELIKQSQEKKQTVEAQIEKVEELKSNIQEKQVITIDDIDFILQQDNGKEMLEDAGLKKGHIDLVREITPDNFKKKNTENLKANKEILKAVINENKAIVEGIKEQISQQLKKDQKLKL